MAAWKLTIRNGSDVTRTKHDDLDEAIEAGRKVVEEVISEPPLRRVKSLRDFAAGRTAGRDTLMSSALVGLSDAELRDLAHHLAHHLAPPAVTAPPR